ncbi:MAG: SBBP repeat-containing protein, partial [Terriglobales bacterium]
YSTYLGGSGTDTGNGIAVDLSGNAYVVGSTISSNFPVTSGAVQPTFGGAGKFDGFVTKINRARSSFVFSTYIGGSGTDDANAVAIDSAANIFIAGDTSSINIFPPGTSGVQPNLAGGTNDAFVAELNPSGSTYVYATYLGGSQADSATGIAVDSTDSVYVVGKTTSTQDFPTTSSSAAQPSSGGVQDAFLTKLDAVGQTRLYSTYFGGSQNDGATGVALNAAGDLYIVGETDSQNFPVTAGAAQTVSTSSKNAFIAEFVTAAQGVFSPNAVGFVAQAPTVASAAIAVQFSNGGEKPLTITKIAATGPYTETDTCSANSSTLQPGQNCTINIVFTPTAVGAQNGSIVITDNAPGGSQTLPLSGSGGDFSLTVAPTHLIIGAGASGNFGLNVTPATGYTKVVTLTCSGIGSQQNATCTPSPTSLTMNGSTTATATYTVNTTVRPALVPPLPTIPPGPWTWLATLALGLAAAGLLLRLRASRRGQRLSWIGAAVLLGWAIAAVGCGGTTTNSGTPPGNYPLTFTATSGSTSHTVTVQLTVN